MFQLLKYPSVCKYLYMVEYLWSILQQELILVSREVFSFVLQQLAQLSSLSLGRWEMVHTCFPTKFLRRDPEDHCLDNSHFAEFASFPDESIQSGSCCHLGNEKSDELIRTGSCMVFIRPEPFMALPNKRFKPPSRYRPTNSLEPGGNIPQIKGR